MPAGRLKLVTRASKSIFDNRRALRRTTKAIAGARNRLRAVARPSVPRDVFGNRKFVKMVYRAHGTLTTSTTVFTTGTASSYRINSLSNPLVGQTTGSVLPQSFSEMVNVYNHYRVKAVKIKITCNDPSDDGLSMLVAVFDSQDAYDIGAKSVNNVAMRKNSRLLRVPGTGHQERSASFYFPIHKLEGISKTAFEGNLSQYEGSVTTTSGLGNPAKIPRVQVAVLNTASATALTCNLTVDINYYTEFYDKLTLSLGTSL